MLVVTLIALVGSTLLVVRGTIFARVRVLWPALLGCSQCAGFWVGAAGGIAGLVSVGRGRALDAVVVGAATSVLSTVVDAVLLKLLGDPED